MSTPQLMAEALRAAARDRTPIRPFTKQNPFLSTAVGYATQELVVGDKRVVGCKLGMTSKVKRDALGIREPVYGRITADMLVPSGQPITVAELIHPRAEPELALVVGRPIPPGADVAVANISLAHVEALLPRLDSRIAVTSGYLESDEPRFGPFARRARRVRDGWAADVLERAQ